jgi:Protein of unknown function (DUF4054)
MVTYVSFIAKYPQFTTIPENRFDLFLTDALLEINRYQWTDLKDRATELLLGHLLSVSNPEDKSAMPVESFEIKRDEGYKVSYQDAESQLGSTWFGREYERLLNLITSNTPNTTTLPKTTYHAVRASKYDIRW